MTAPTEALTTHENILAAAMLHRLGNMTVAYTLADNGALHYEQGALTVNDRVQLEEQFRQDPKESLAYARQSLFAIQGDEKLSDRKKEKRLDSYLDAYFDLTVKLDHTAFPNTADGTVNAGVPEYIPDGFIDMGGDSELDPYFRHREQIWVDKRAMLEDNKDMLKKIFMMDMSEYSHTERKQVIASILASKVYYKMPYDHQQKDLGGDKHKLSQMQDVVCRHHALVFQVLAQAMGLKTRLLKSYMDGGRHATNMVRFDGQWYLFDVTNPDHETMPDGKNKWRPGAYPVDGPPLNGEEKIYPVKQAFSGEAHTYRAHNKMFWRIEQH